MCAGCAGDSEGTGHAVRIGWDAVPGPEHRGIVLVAYGDTPVVGGREPQGIRGLPRSLPGSDQHLVWQGGRPGGYGRIIRNDQGQVEAIVEHKDASDEQRLVDEINSGILAFDADFLDRALPLLSNANAAGEYYLTDTVALARQAGETVEAFVLDDVDQTEGANDRVQLAKMGKEKNRRILLKWMRAGVTIMDPDTTWIDADVRLESDVTILPGVQLLGATVVAEDAVVGPDCTLKDVEIGQGARVIRAHGELAVIGAGAEVGPFSYLRPGTQLGPEARLAPMWRPKMS
ncbi:MAG: hypothetical protein R2709_12295 [Marmoricola sp.]